jgi:hypothetical protein
MIARTIEDVSESSINPTNNHLSSVFVNVSDSFILQEKINTATTLALLVGLIQVSFECSQLLIMLLLVVIIFFTTRFFNCLLN